MTHGNKVAAPPWVRRLKLAIVLVFSSALVAGILTCGRSLFSL